MKTLIVIEIENFLGQYSLTQAALAKEAGVSRVQINRLLKGIRRETTSSYAHAFRAAMHRLTATVPVEGESQEPREQSSPTSGRL